LITDDRDEPTTADGRLKDAVKQVLERDLKADIMLEEVAKVLDAAKPPRDSRSKEGDLFDTLLQHLRGIINGGDKNAPEKVQAVGELVGYKSRLSKFAESLFGNGGRGRNLAESLNGTNHAARKRSADFLAAIM
jgi:hypothetical protein